MIRDRGRFAVQKPKKSKFKVNIHAADMYEIVWGGSFARDLIKIRRNSHKMEAKMLKLPIVGMRYVKGGRDKLNTASNGTLLELRPEPENKFDKNAVRVFIKDDDAAPFMIGYIAKASTRLIPETCRAARLGFKGLMPIAIIDA
jgi:HIRAN domain